MKFKNVFAAHPKAKEIYVVNGLPFVNKRYAENYAAEVKAEVETIERRTEKAEPKDEGKEAKPKTAKKK